MMTFATSLVGGFACLIVAITRMQDAIDATSTIERAWCCLFAPVWGLAAIFFFMGKQL